MVMEAMPGSAVNGGGATQFMGGGFSPPRCAVLMHAGCSRTELLPHSVNALGHPTFCPPTLLLAPCSPDEENNYEAAGKKVSGP